MSPLSPTQAAAAALASTSNPPSKELGFALKHRQLNEVEREEYRQVAEEVEAKAPAFLWMRKHPHAFLSFEMAFAVLTAAALWSNGTISSLGALVQGVLYFIIGFAALQALFVVGHATSHAMMLEYSAHKPGNERMHERPVVYLYAFYHHHHSRSDDWAPNLSYHDPLERNVFEEWGTRSVITSHWASFSIFNIFDRPTLWLPVFLCACMTMYASPMTMLFWLGYEMGVILLPFGHAHQHIRASRVPQPIRSLLRVLDATGVIAGRAEHGPHHIHTSELVYQSFGSSGLYMKHIGVGQAFDRLIDFLWEKYFRLGIKEHRQPYEYWANVSGMLGGTIMFIIPAILAMTS